MKLSRWGSQEWLRLDCPVASAALFYRIVKCRFGPIRNQTFEGDWEILNSGFGENKLNRQDRFPYVAEDISLFVSFCIISLDNIKLTLTIFEGGCRNHLQDKSYEYYVLWRGTNRISCEAFSVCSLSVIGASRIVQVMCVSYKCGQVCWRY